jgi:hypothetical protein
MPREKVTLTLDAATMAELRRLVDARSLSAAVQAALEAHVERLRHQAALAEWLDELEVEHGPVPPDAAAWAAGLADAWEATTSPQAS